MLSEFLVGDVQAQIQVDAARLDDPSSSTHSGGPDIIELHQQPEDPDRFRRISYLQRMKQCCTNSSIGVSPVLDGLNPIPERASTSMQHCPQCSQQWQIPPNWVARTNSSLKRANSLVARSNSSLRRASTLIPVVANPSPQSRRWRQCLSRWTQGRGGRVCRGNMVNSVLCGAIWFFAYLNPTLCVSNRDQRCSSFGWFRAGSSQRTFASLCHK